MINNQSNDDLLTPEEVAELLRVPQATLYSWRHAGRGPTASKLGRHLRYMRSDVYAWVKGQSGPAESRPDPVTSRTARSNRNLRR